MNDLENAISALREGRFIIVADDQKRENEGDLIMAADKVTPAAIAFMVRYTSGVICMPMTRERLEALRIPLMVENNTESHRTAFTVSVDYRYGTTTGISAADRAKTIRALIDPNALPEDFNRPGHVFPLKAKDGGVLERPGHTEAAIDLCRLAGLYPAGILCELVNDDGTMMRGSDLEKFSALHNLPMITIEQLSNHLLGIDNRVEPLFRQ